MSKRPEITKMLSLSIQKLINPYNDNRIYWAREVTFDHLTENMCRVDFMQFKPVNNTVSGIEKGNFYCYEVKSSVEDFHSKNGHNFIGDFNYYVMPEEVYEKVKDEIPYRVGVYVPAGNHHSGKWCYLTNIKKAKRQNRAKPVAEMLLMMFRSSTRDFIRQQSNGWIPCSERLPNTKEYAENEDMREFIVMIEGATESTVLGYSETGEWLDEDGNYYRVVAWQPFPEPYRNQLK